MEWEERIKESVSISNAARNAVDASTRAKEVSVTSEVASTVSDETSSEPAYQISLSSESLVLSASSNVNNQDVSATIRNTIGYIFQARDIAKGLLNNYDYNTSNDNAVDVHYIRNNVNQAWGGGYPTNTPDTWAAHAKYEHGRRIVIDGSENLRNAMTDVFNDLRFGSKDEVRDAYSTLNHACVIMELYM